MKKSVWILTCKQHTDNLMSVNNMKLSSKLTQRSDRLYKIILHLRDGGLHTAADLSRNLGVTPRTIYRDMDRLVASGIDICGTPGLGYRSGASVSLPALNLTNEELEVLHLGLAIIGEGPEPELQRAALSLSQKIEAVLPEEGQSPPQPFGFALYPLPTRRADFSICPLFALRFAAVKSYSYPMPLPPTKSSGPSVWIIGAGCGPVSLGAKRRIALQASGSIS